MFAKIASFELRYQLRNPVFWVVAILFFLMTFGAATIPQIQIGSGGNVHKNSHSRMAIAAQAGLSAPQKNESPIAAIAADKDIFI